MKKNPLIQKALDDWNYSLNEPTEEEYKKKILTIKKILSTMRLTDRQKEIFYLFVHLGNASEVGRRLQISEFRVREVVKKVRLFVKKVYKIKSNHV